ncbi:GlsB/YeaQ/YmgE family stress response membrane protein [Pontiellaceae bacterium B12227]|nr:GlsB/YeaQ/YmgE family stress response membrane protein [Pontiellaceae bacterium B12227]
MNAEQLVAFLIVGGVAGWLAGLIMKGRGLGLVGNIVVGVIGAFLGGWLFGILGIRIDGKWLGPLITSLAGALLLLFGVSFIQKK